MTTNPFYLAPVFALLALVGPFVYGTMDMHYAMREQNAEDRLKFELEMMEMDLLAESDREEDRQLFLYKFSHAMFANPGQAR